MEKYKLFWKDIWIGQFFVENGKHKYEAFPDAINKLNTTVPLDPVIIKSRDWGEEIPFLKSRLENTERFPGLEIAYATDSYRLEKVSEDV